jgi:hypothetical protein
LILVTLYTDKRKMKITIVTSCVVLLAVIIHTDHVTSAPAKSSNQGSSDGKGDQSKRVPSEGRQGGDDEGKSGKGKNNGSFKGNGRKVGHELDEDDKKRIQDEIKKERDERKEDGENPGNKEKKDKERKEAIERIKEWFNNGQRNGGAGANKPPVAAPAPDSPSGQPAQPPPRSVDPAQPPPGSVPALEPAAPAPPKAEEPAAPIAEEPAVQAPPSGEEAPPLLEEQPAPTF